MVLYFLYSLYQRKEKNKNKNKNNISQFSPMDAVFDLKKAYHLDVFMHMGSQGFFLVIIIIFL